MLIGDMLNLVGALQFKQFEWGEALVNYFNDQLDEHTVDKTHLLSVESTGVDARAALFSLPAAEMAALVVKDFDPGSRTIHDTPAAPVAGPTPAQVPFPSSPTPKPAPKPAPKITDPVGMISALPQKAKNNLSLIMGGTLVIVTLLLAVAMSVTTVKKGEMPDSKALESVMQILGEVVKTYIKQPAPAPVQKL